MARLDWWRGSIIYGGVMASKSRKRQEYGDFQTPLKLAHEVCSLLLKGGCDPVSIIEPTCGVGNFLVAALQAFPGVEHGLGMDINPDYVCKAKAAVDAVPGARSVNVLQGDVFDAEWQLIAEPMPDPLLIIGNPPWVTNTALGLLGSSNTPEKINFQKHRGIDAITGKGNFDISEWMIIKLLELMQGHRATLAMLCKTTVARKVLYHSWKTGHRIERAHIYPIDSATHFGITADACLLVVTVASVAKGVPTLDCNVYNSLSDHSVKSVVGYEDGRLLSDASLYQRWKHLEGRGPYTWRSGIKHDCAKIMELRGYGGEYENGLGERVSLEKDYLFPMLKSSDINKRFQSSPSRFMLVTQRYIGEDTAVIQHLAPKTWKYLEDHSEVLDRRASSIYHNRPRFSVFGVGEYAFGPWKVGISGFYKNMNFTVVGPFSDKPVVFDDTCYFLSCQTRNEATAVAEILNSEIAQEFFSALVFWDSKRPVTAEVLQRLDLAAAARELNVELPLHEHQSEMRMV